MDAVIRNMQKATQVLLLKADGLHDALTGQMFGCVKVTKEDKPGPQSLLETLDAMIGEINDVAKLISDLEIQVRNVSTVYKLLA